MNRHDSPCPICHKEDATYFHTENGYPLVKCHGCGLIYVKERPTQEELSKHYEHYLPVSKRDILAWQNMMKPVMNVSLTVINQYARQVPRRILDVGCGYGFFLKRMEHQGWTVTGVDISPVAIWYARERLGLNIHKGPLETLNLPCENYGVLTAFYVIEHLPDPVSFLKEAKRLLAPGGVLLLRWPNTSPLVRITRPFWGDLGLYDTPSHLQDFTHEVLSNTLADLGFTEIKTIIGGFTLPSSLRDRLISVISWSLAQVLWVGTGKGYLLPGISKTTLARKR